MTFYVTTSGTRTSTFRKLAPWEHQPQLTPGLEHHYVISGPTKDLINYGLHLKTSGLAVSKAYNASGDCQLIVNYEHSDLTIAHIKQAGFTATRLHDFRLGQGEIIVAIQKKGTKAQAFLDSVTVTEYARFVQPSGGARLALIIAEADVPEFLTTATQEGFDAFNTRGKMYPQRNYNPRKPNDGLTTRNKAATGGEVEIAAIPLIIPDRVIESTANEILPGYKWISQKGSSPFNYSMIGFDRSTPPRRLTQEQIWDLEEIMEDKFAAVVSIDRGVYPDRPPKQNQTHGPSLPGDPRFSNIPWDIVEESDGDDGVIGG